MSPDIRDTLRHAADDSAAPTPIAAHALLRQAHQRSRNKRLVRAGLGTAAVAAVAATATGVGLAVLRGDGNAGGPSSPDSGGADRSPTSTASAASVGSYTPVWLSEDEAIARCAADDANRGMKPGRIYVPQYPAQHPGNKYAAGEAVALVPKESANPGLDLVVCVIPFTGAERDPGVVKEPIADAQDAAGVLRQCGVVAGYDFTGWQVVTATSAAQGTSAVLRSDNGYIATCSLQPDGWDSGSPQEVQIGSLTEAQVAANPLPGPTPYLIALDASAMSIKTAHTPIQGQLWSGAGALYGTDGRRATDAKVVLVKFRDTGASFEAPVVDGYYAVRYHNPAARGGVGEFDYVVKDDAGKVLARGGSDDLMYE